MFYTKKYKPEPNKNLPRNLTKCMFPAFFHKEGLDFIHIDKNLRKEEVTSKLPNILRNDETSSVVYSLASTTQNKLLSFKDIVNNIHFNNLETFGTKL